MMKLEGVRVPGPYEREPISYELVREGSFDRIEGCEGRSPVEPMRIDPSVTLYLIDRYGIAHPVFVPRNIIQFSAACSTMPGSFCVGFG